MGFIKTTTKFFQSSALCKGLGLSLLLLCSACSDEETEATEWDNWQQRNEAFFASLQDSLRLNPSQWQRIKLYSLDPATEGRPTDYIYAKTIEAGTGTDSPAYTDTVRVVYKGSLIPTASYPDGLVFDGLRTGTFSAATGNASIQVPQQMIDGYSTALQHMRQGDHWRVYIPSDLGYGDNDYTGGSVTIPGHSTLIFELQLINFSHTGTPLPAWSARRR